MTINHTWLAVETGERAGLERCVALRGSSGDQRCVALRGSSGSTLRGSSGLRYVACVALRRSTLRGLRGCSGLRYVACVALRESNVAWLFGRFCTHKASRFRHFCMLAIMMRAVVPRMCLLVKLCLWPLGSASIALLVGWLFGRAMLRGSSGLFGALRDYVVWLFRSCTLLAIMIHAVHAVLSPGGVVLTCQAVLLMVSWCLCVLCVSVYGASGFRRLNVSSLLQ